MPRLWVLMSDLGREDEVVAEVDTIDEARTALAAALRREADDRYDGGLYRVTAEAVEKLWRGRLNGTLEVGYGSGLAEEPPLTDREFQAMQRRCRQSGGDACDVVPEVTSSWTVTDRDPDAYWQQHPDPRYPRRAPRRYEDDEWSDAWEPGEHLEAV